MRSFRMLFVLLLAAGVAALWFHAGAASPAEKAEKPKLRIGTYDSRAVAIAFAHSEMWRQHVGQLMREHEKAKAAGDEKKIKELEAEGKAGQDLFHQQGFSTAPVDNILQRIKDKIPAIAQRAGVDLIVSKWAVTYQAPDVEAVDVTDLLVEPFGPNETARRMIKGSMEATPIPLDKLRIETHE